MSDTDPCQFLCLHNQVAVFPKKSGRINFLQNKNNNFPEMASSTLIYIHQRLLLKEYIISSLANCGVFPLLRKLHAKISHLSMEKLLSMQRGLSRHWNTAACEALFVCGFPHTFSSSTLSNPSDSKFWDCGVSGTLQLTCTLLGIMFFGM